MDSHPRRRQQGYGHRWLMKRQFLGAQRARVGPASQAGQGSAIGASIEATGVDIFLPGDLCDVVVGAPQVKREVPWLELF